MAARIKADHGQRRDQLAELLDRLSDEPRLPSSIAGLENFSLTRDEKKPEPELDADSFFNLPDADDEDDDDN